MVRNEPQHSRSRAGKDKVEDIYLEGEEEANVV